MQSEPSEAPERIYLEPVCCVDPIVGRNWCEDDVWPTSPDCDKTSVEYIRADLATRTDSRPDCSRCGKPIIMTASECDGCATRSLTDAVEAVARALCSLDIRAKRRHDTDAGKLAAMLPAAVDYAWPEYVNQAEVALAALPPSGEVEREDAFLSGFCAGKGVEHVTDLSTKDFHAAGMASQDYEAALRNFDGEMK